jgi:hypothetical protein
VNSRTAVWLAWSLWIVSAASFVTALLLQSVNRSSEDPFLVQMTLILGFTSFATVGAVVCSRRPDNRIGWIFVAVGVLLGCGLLGQEYSRYAYVTEPQPLPARTLAAWVASWYWYPSLMLVSFMTPLLFPTGRPPSRRWRPLLWVGVIGTICVTLLAALPERIGDGFSIRNPIGLYSTPDPESEPIFTVLGLILLVALPFVVASLIVRFRTSRGQERQQLKWFLFAIFIVLIGNVLPERFFGWIGSAVFGLGVTAVPVAVGIAILRHRLYDIDRIINRSLVYGALTALLVAGYTACVLLLQTLLPLANESPVAVAVSTFAMAALFGPLRRRIQAVVDRRFNRQRYNAALTVEKFGDSLRRQTDLDAVTLDLLDVVGRTLEPAHASLWLQSTSHRRVTP